jgi:hypothetical protein
LLYPNYLCVFRADQEVYDDVVDYGLDPDFRPPIQTCGIYRPPTRQSVVPGSYVVFHGYYTKDRRHLVKGWMRVGEKISYLKALEHFGDRPNVIVRELTDHEARQPKLLAEVSWKCKPLQQESLRQYGTVSPRFLTTIDVKGRVYVQLMRTITKSTTGSASGYSRGRKYNSNVASWPGRVCGNRGFLI